MQDLDGEQRQRVEQLARDRGMTCKRCGSPELESGDIAQAYVGRFGVDLWCSNRGDEDVHPGTFNSMQKINLSRDEARWVGLRT